MAIFDALVVGVGLWFLGVPLAVLVFLGAYIPYAGAFVSGLVAELVGLAEGGLGTAAAVLVLIVVVQMVDGNIIQPLVMGKVVEVTAVTVIVSIAIGATLREVGRLERSSDQSPEAGWIRTWLDTLLELPWGCAPMTTPTWRLRALFSTPKLLAAHRARVVGGVPAGPQRARPR